MKNIMMLFIVWIVAANVCLAADFSDDQEKIEKARQEGLLMLQLPSHGALPDLISNISILFGTDGRISQAKEFLLEAKDKKQNILILCSDSFSKKFIDKALQKLEDKSLSGVFFMYIGGDACVLPKQELDRVSADYANN